MYYFALVTLCRRNPSSKLDEQETRGKEITAIILGFQNIASLNLYSNVFICINHYAVFDVLKTKTNNNNNKTKKQKTGRETSKND